MPTVIMEAPNARMEVEFPPDWRVLRDLRLFVNKLVSSVARSEDIAERVSMVVTELAENAVKYSLSDTALVRLRVQPTESGIRCEAENLAAPAQIDELRRILDRVNEGDPKDAYARALVEACDSTAPGSKVGLARIRTEGQMTLTCEIRESSVRMIAEMMRH